MLSYLVSRGFWLRGFYVLGVYQNRRPLTSLAMFSRWAGRPSERELSEPLVLGRKKKMMTTRKELLLEDTEALHQGVHSQCAKQTQTRRAEVPWQRGERLWHIQCAVLETVMSPRTEAFPSSFLLS